MKKSANTDINNLFNKFGGDTGTYQEIQHDYAIEKAQQNWPIVGAIEKAQVVAPKLRSAANRTPQVAQVRLQTATDRISSPTPSSVPTIQPGSTLFASLTAKPVQADTIPANNTLNSFFGTLKEKESAQPAPLQTSENDPLNTVFTRLLGAQEPAIAPDKNLRSLFGFLSK